MFLRQIHDDPQTFLYQICRRNLLKNDFWPTSTFETARKSKKNLR